MAKENLSAHIFINPGRVIYADLFIPRDRSLPVRFMARVRDGPARMTAISRRKAAGILWLMYLISKHSKTGRNVSLHSLLRGTVSRSIIDGRKADPLGLQVFESLYIAGFGEVKGEDRDG